MARAESTSGCFGSKLRVPRIWCWGDAVHAELETLSGVARRFLNSRLPAEGGDWWTTTVLDVLSVQQRLHAQEAGWTSLDDLDLAALLRVTDRNWELLKRGGYLAYESRNWLKEALTVRNRWAHSAPGREPDARQRHRDVDTVLRLAIALDAPSQDRSRLESSLTAALAMLAPSGEDRSAPQKAKPEGLAAGAQVRLVARPEIVGVVMDSSSTGPAARYRVFMEGTVQTLFAEQISEIVTPDSSQEVIPAATMHRTLSAHQLLKPSSRLLYSLNAGRVDYEPYQFRPVLKLVQADRPRLLIADDVGVGKTIEAGFILKELQARQELQSVLVFCPKSLVTEDKWRSELKRFSEDFINLDGPSLRQGIADTFLDGQWPARYRKVILPYSLLDEAAYFGSRKRKGLIDLDVWPKFDLVIVDEAHNIRNTETWRYRIVKQFVDSAEAAVMLSATPVQTRSQNLFTLLNLLRPDLVGTVRDFEQMGRPNPFLSKAAAAARRGGDGWQLSAAEALFEALSTDWGSTVVRSDPRLREVVDLLSSDVGGDDVRVQAVRGLEALNTFSGLISRTRRRDIGDFTTRKPETVEVEFTCPQADVYRDLLDLSRRITAARLPGVPAEFLLSTLQRQASSCLLGLAPLIEDVLHRRLGMDVETLAEDEPPVDPALLAEFSPEIRNLAQRAAELGPADPKFDRLLRIVRDKATMPNRRLIVFSTFRHTLAYLDRRLRDEGVQVAMIHGGTSDDDRRALRGRFKIDGASPEAIDVLLFSEVGTEGLDYQFCDAMVNYDIPWNPMRVEQRIGRIDRRGQTSEVVAISNFVTPGTIDAVIYQRCLERIGVFRQSLGGSEEILGEITSEIRSIAENLSLTDEERADRLQQLADNKIGRLHEQEALEKQESQFFGLAVQRSDQQGVDEATSPWLTPSRITDLVSGYLATVDPTRTIRFKDGVATLRPTDAVRARLLRDLATHALPGTDYLAWERWLRGKEPTRTLAATPQNVGDDPATTELLGLAHPLVRAAAASARQIGMRRVSLAARSDRLAVGVYPFGIFAWRRLGDRDDHQVTIVAADVSAQVELAALLPFATDAEGPVSDGRDAEVEERHFELWADARVAHIESARSGINARQASLAATHRARVRQLEEQFQAADNAKIRIMREAERRNADADYRERDSALQASLQGCDLLSEPIIIGTLDVRP